MFRVVPFIVMCGKFINFCFSHVIPPLAVRRDSKRTVSHF